PELDRGHVRDGLAVGAEAQSLARDRRAAIGADDSARVHAVLALFGAEGDPVSLDLGDSGVRDVVDLFQRGGPLTQRLHDARVLARQRDLPARVGQLHGIAAVVWEDHEAVARTGVRPLQAPD